MKKLVLMIAMAASCTPKDATPAGTTVIDWDGSKSSRATFVAAKTTARVSKDMTVTWTPSMGHPVVATLHVESGRVEFDEGKEHVSQTATVAVTMKVVRNDKWKMNGSCDGPNYQMPSVGGDGGFITPMGMLVDCHLNVAQGGSNDILEMRMGGDGKVETWGVSGKVDIQ